MNYFRALERILARWFGRLPDLSEGTREMLVRFWPWLALVGGLFQLFAAWSLYVWARSTKDLIDLADRVSANYGVELEVGRWNFWIALAFITLIADAVVLLLAFPKLQARLKSGWNLMLVSGVLSFLYAFFALFIRERRGVWDDVWSLIVTIVVFYLLFQVRSKYAGKHKLR